VIPKPPQPVLNRKHPLARGLAGAWYMDYDLTKRTRSTISDLVNITKTKGGYGAALRFSGAASAYKVICSPLSLNVTGRNPWTFSFLVTTTSVTSYGWLLSIAHYDAAMVQVFRYLDSIEVGRAVANAGTGQTATSGAAAIAVNVLTHIVALYDGSALGVYIDGRLWGSMTDTANASDVGSQQFIGNQCREPWSQPVRGWAGSIYDVRCWSRSL